MVGAVAIALLAGTAFVSDDPRPAVVTVGAGPEGKVVAGPGGMALYTFDGFQASDECVDECLRTWPALLATPDDKPVGEWAPRPRPGGALQWTFRGEPIYTYSGDRAPGAASGDGMGGVWHALAYIGPKPRVSVPPAAQISRRGADFLLSDHRGHTLYTFARDKGGAACTGECLDVWPPLLAPGLARPVGEWTPVVRPDGVRQWAYQGKLVYTFSEDTLPGEVRGAGSGGVWSTITLTAPDVRTAAR